MQPSNIKPTIGQLVTVELGLLGVNATVEHQDVVSINLLNNCTLECGTANEYWGCDLVESHGDVRQSFTLSVRSDDERKPSLIAREIANLIYRLDQAQQVIGERWMVQADKEHAGQHPSHDYRFITTADYDDEAIDNNGVVVCAMRDLPSIREVASHIVAVHNASIQTPVKELEQLRVDGNINENTIRVLRLWVSHYQTYLNRIAYRESNGAGDDFEMTKIIAQEALALTPNGI